MLVEVKNRSRRASAADLDAFVTKARDQNANKAVFVTAAGFQKGAIEVAKRHGVDLFTVAFDESAPELSSHPGMLVRGAPHGAPADEPALKLSEPHLVYAIERVELHYLKGGKHEVPKEASQMSYYSHKTLTSDGRTLAELIRPDDAPELEDGQEVHLTINFEPPVRIYPPDGYFFPAGTLKSARISVAGRLARALRGNLLVEPTSFRCPIVDTNVLSGEQTRYSIDQLPLGAEPPRPGRFYFMAHPIRYLHCKSIEQDLVTWELVESFQLDRLVTATYTQQLRYAAHYIPVVDRKTVNRLEKRLRDYRGRQARSL